MLRSAAPSATGLLLAGALACACAAPPPRGPYLLRPLDAAGRPAASGTVSVERDRFRLDVEPLTAPERAAWLRRTHDLDTDPLAARGGRYVTLRVALAARGGLPLHLETQSVMLWFDGGRPVKPLDYTRAFELLRGGLEGTVDEAEVARFMRGLLDGPVDVPAGGRREGLLVFPEPPESGETVQLEIPFLQVGSESEAIRLTFGKLYLGADEGGRTGGGDASRR